MKRKTNNNNNNKNNNKKLTNIFTKANKAFTSRQVNTKLIANYYFFVFIIIFLYKLIFWGIPT